MTDTLGNQSTTASIIVGGTYNDSLETFGDRDWIRITLTAGQSITVFVDGITLEDSYLRIHNSAGTLLYENDDIVSGVNRDSQLSFTASTAGHITSTSVPSTTPIPELIRSRSALTRRRLSTLTTRSPINW